MRIKSLLLGTAATMVAVSGAQAADAIVVEPEPVEYVRVCDAYGSGFFYIPGTETCISINGFVRSGYEKLDIDGTIDGALVGGVQATASSATQTTLSTASGSIVFSSATVGAGSPTVDPSFVLWGQRARLNIDTRNETDWGTLRAQYRLEGGQSNTDVDIDMDRALISLAGFRFGFSDNYWSTNHGYGWINAESLASTASGINYPDGFYGFDDATLADYTWAADGLSITVGAEDPRISYGRDSFGNATNNGGTDSRVNFYAGFNYAGDGWGVAGTAVHDSIAPEMTGSLIGTGGSVNDIGGWAYKVSANLDLSSLVPGGTLWGMWMHDGDYNTDYVHGNLLTENPETVWGVAYGMDLTDEIQFWTNFYHVDGGVACTGMVTPGQGGNCASGVAGLSAGIEEGDVNAWSVGLNWYPAAAPGFHIKTAYTRGTVLGSASYLVSAGNTDGVSFDYDGFEINVRRDF